MAKAYDLFNFRLYVGDRVLCINENNTTSLHLGTIMNISDEDSVWVKMDCDVTQEQLLDSKMCYFLNKNICGICNQPITSKLKCDTCKGYL